MAKHKIYVASSWRNEFYTQVVESLRSAGHDVYDFRNPPSGGHGFKWSEIDPDYMDWSPVEYQEKMEHPLAQSQLKNDIEAMLLPAYKVQSGDDYTRVFLYPKKDVKEMTKEERIQACYQHTCLLYEDKVSVTNQTMRERFGLDAKGTSMISHIIADTLESGLIKYENPVMSSKRYATYIPFYG